MRGIRDEAAGVAQDELDVRVLAANAVAHQQVGRPSSVEQEVGGKRRHAGAPGRKAAQLCVGGTARADIIVSCVRGRKAPRN
jgi:hypothetical protein